MRKVSAVHAKAHFAELVAAAEHHGTVTMIQKHGKTAAIVGPESLLASARKRRGMTPQEIAALHAMFEGQGEPAVSAVDDLLSGRR